MKVKDILSNFYEYIPEGRCNPCKFAKYVGTTFIGNDGRLSCIAGKEERVERVDQARTDVTRLMEEVGELRRKVKL